MITWTLYRGGREAWPDLAADALSACEQERLSGLRVPKRRDDWLLGRLAAKLLVRSWVEGETGCTLPLPAITIANEPSGAPVVRFDSRGSFCPAPPSISLSHSHSTALCALSSVAGLRFGADIEWVEPRSAWLVEDFMTAEERAQVAAASPANRDRIVTALWSAKEAVLKALRLGLTVDTRSVCCRLEHRAREWSSFRAELAPELWALGGTEVTGWWRVHEGFVLTIATLGPQTVLLPVPTDLDPGLRLGSRSIFNGARRQPFQTMSPEVTA